jgi:hypothetical protein
MEFILSYKMDVGRRKEGGKKGRFHVKGICVG